MLMLSINTDFRRDDGDPEPSLRQIAGAGFTHIHWVHHWGDDYLYSRHEIAQIGRWLNEYGLTLNDLHASAGREKYWLSEHEYARLSGVELVKNRIEMTAVLGSDTIVLHLPAEPTSPEWNPPFWDHLYRSLDELLPFARAQGVRLAMENLYPVNHATLHRVLAEFSPDEIGICYDPGHGNIVGDGLDFIEEAKDRLIALHLNDNDSSWDQHNFIFSATVDWDRMARIIATSPYQKPLGLELTINHSGIENEREFLAQAMETSERFARMVEEARTAGE